MKKTMGVVALTLGFALSLWGCSGSSSTETPDPVAEAAQSLSEERVAEGWPVQYATIESFADYQSPGWVTLVQDRNYRDSVEKLDGLGAARAHAEAASLFKQAALVSVNAAIETYAKTPQKTDPVGAAHLLAVGYALNGDLAKAREASARLDGVEDVTVRWHAPWKAWLAGPAAWPPDLSALPVELPEVQPGVWPVLDDIPHYELPVQAEGDLAQPMGDPGSLVALALWHEKAARMAAGEQADQIALYTARYRFPIEPAPPAAPLTMPFLYASDMLVPADGAFLADLTGKMGAAAVDKHKDTSLTAYLASLSREDGKVNAERAVDIATALRDSIVDQSKAKTNAEVLRHHRMFADIAYTGLLRNLAFVADAEGGDTEGGREEGGKLRLIAMDASNDHTGCAVALMSLAAWDTGNRFPSRAQEIIHRNSNFYPSLEAARYGLDVLALRVGRERVETPGM